MPKPFPAAENHPVLIIDARMVGTVPHGIARYVLALVASLRALESLQPLPYRPVFLVSKNTPLLWFEPFSTQQVRAPFLHPREWLEIPFYLRQHQAFLYHSPSFSSLPYCPCPSLITLHDLNHLSYGSWWQKQYYQHCVKPFSKRSQAILTVSRFAQQEIAAWLKLPQAQIVVTPNALPPGVRPRERPLNASEASLFQAAGLTPQAYFLCLSGPKPHKNRALLLQAYQQTSCHFPLVFPEKTPSCLPQQATRLRGLDPQTAALLQDEQLPLLMSQAAALFFPSLYEGFGLPPLEAASQGTPIVVSAIAPHQEVLCDLNSKEVLWVPAKDLKAWKEAFEAVEQGKGPTPTNLRTRQQLTTRFSVIKLAEHLQPLYLRGLNQYLGK